MAISLNGSTGVITGVSVGGLPDGIVDSDMLAASAVSTAKLASGSVSSAKLASGVGGKILQVVHTSTSTEVSVSTTTFTDLGLSASITPSSSSNKIIVQAYVPAYYSRSGGQGGGIKVFRDSTVIYNSYADGSGPYEIFGGAATIATTITTSILDSPATTSSTTYKLQGRPYLTTSSGRADFFENGGSVQGSGSLILMEVAA